MSTRNNDKKRDRSASTDVVVLDDDSSGPPPPPSKGAKHASAETCPRGGGVKRVATESRPSYASAALATPSGGGKASSSAADLSTMSPVQESYALTSCPLDSALLSSFGGFDRKTVAILEDFFGSIVHEGDEDVVRGLFLLSEGLKRAVDAYSILSKQFDDVNGQLHQALNAKSSVETLKEALCMEIIQLKVIPN